MKNVILKGDTLKVLKEMNDNFIDMGVTSPPYNKKQPKSSKNSIFNAITYDSVDDNLPEEIYQEQQINVLNELYRVIKPGGSFFYNHKIRHLKGIATHPMEWVTKSKWHLRQEIIWNRRGPLEVGGYRFYQVDERIYWLYKPLNKNVIGKKLESKHARLSSVWEFAPDKKNPHPAPFPLVLPLRCILSFLNYENGLVIDPYMGSGTSAVAAKLLGSDYIGIDISDEYIKKAEERIDNYELERKVLEKEEELHFVKKSYKQRKKESLL
jgi:site-specific DNA-methyltransferase (adenine-specific)